MGILHNAMASIQELLHFFHTHTHCSFCVYACVGGGSWIPFNGVRLLIASRQLFRYKGRVCPHRTYTLVAFSLSYTMQWPASRSCHICSHRHCSDCVCMHVLGVVLGSPSTESGC